MSLILKGKITMFSLSAWASWENTCGGLMRRFGLGLLLSTMMRSTSNTPPTIFQFIRFCLVGGLNTGVHYGMFFALFRLLGLHYLISSTIGYCCGTVNSFIWNKMWTFESRRAAHITEALKFLIVNTSSLVTNVTSMKVFVAGMGMRPEFAQVLTIGLTATINFVGYKFWAFRRRVSLSSRKGPLIEQLAYKGESSDICEQG
jgi:putative flippase GtrA